MATKSRIKAHELLSFHIQSDDPASCRKEMGRDYYLVDLSSYDGQGRCDCRDFRCRIEPKLSRGQKPPKRFCKHIIAARDQLLDMFIAEFLRRFGPTNDT